MPNTVGNCHLTMSSEQVDYDVALKLKVFIYAAKHQNRAAGCK
jgi:hypothetical protein